MVSSPSAISAQAEFINQGGRDATHSSCVHYMGVNKYIYIYIYLYTYVCVYIHNMYYIYTYVYYVYTQMYIYIYAQYACHTLCITLFYTLYIQTHSYTCLSTYAIIPGHVWVTNQWISSSGLQRCFSIGINFYDLNIPVANRSEVT